MKGRILIVDDDHDYKEAIKMVLETKGYEVTEASNGDEGYKLAKETKPDLILLDVMMAHKSEGFDVARKINNDEDIKDIPVIIISGVQKEMNLPFKFNPDSTWLPVKAVLDKPVKPDTLLAEIEKYIGK